MKLTFVRGTIREDNGTLSKSLEEQMKRFSEWEHNPFKHQKTVKSKSMKGMFDIVPKYNRQKCSTEECSLNLNRNCKYELCKKCCKSNHSHWDCSAHWKWTEQQEIHEQQ